MGTPRSYVICTAPRSGSTLLCHLLRATGVAGWPGSHFHRPSLTGWLDAYGLREADFANREEAARAALAAGRAKGRGGGDIFGLRMQRGSFACFTDILASLYPDIPGEAARIEAAFGPTLFIHLTRPDRLGQAISRLKAEQSGLWHRHADGRELERLAPAAPPRYDASAIAAHMAEAEAFDGAWEAWFAAEGLAPLRLTYDALARDPQGVLARVLTALDRDPRVAGTVPIPTARLADGTSEAWRARFLATRAP